MCRKSRLGNGFIVLAMAEPTRSVEQPASDIAKKKNDAFRIRESGIVMSEKRWPESAGPWPFMKQKKKPTGRS